MKKIYNPTITLKKAALMAAPGVLLGAITGASAVLQGWDDQQAIAATITAVIIGALTGALRGLENFLKNSGVIMLIFVAGACLAFPGCMSLTPYGPGALSSNNVKVVESTAHAEGVDTFALEIKSRGDAAAKTSVKYTGEAEADETPWAFAVLGEANVESAERVKPLNEGAGAALAALPVTLAPLVDALSLVNDAPEGTPGASIRDRLMGLIMDRVLGAITGGGTP